MPSLRPGRSKPWLARVKVDGAEYCLGFYENEEDARISESEFRLAVGVKEPPRRAR